MPKVVMNFQNTIIYKIVPKNVTLDFVYVGHTTNFILRKSLHKKACCNEKTKLITLTCIKQSVQI